MENFINKSQNRKRLFKIMILIMIFAVFFININFVLAATVGDAAETIGNVALGTIGTAVMSVLAVIAYLLTAVIGLLITVVVALLIQVAQFSNIINVDTVIKGWVIIRDLCNMFFILILLIIAFATILRQENYSAKKILPKLLIMAILINFSRTIFGLLIDVSQIIMLTFVNAFAAGGGWFIEAFQVNKWYKLNVNSSGDFAVSTWSTSIAIIAGVLAAIITLIVMSVMLAVLVARIVMLWIYTIFSPLIFLGFAFTPLQKYTGKLWEDFTKQLVVGPVLAFFIWLALTTAQSSSDLMSGALDPSQARNQADQQICVGAGAFFCQGNFQKFIIVIGLLMGGLMVAQQMGGAAGSIAGKGLDWAKKSIATSMAPIKSIPQAGSWVARKFAASKHGFEIRPSKVIAGFKETLAEKKRKEDIRIEEKSASMLKEGKVIRGGLGASRDFSEAAAHGFLWNRAWKRSDDPEKMGVIQSTWKVGSIKKEIAKLEKERADVRNTPARNTEIDKDIADQRTELGKYSTPQTFYALQKSLASYEQAAKKSGMKDNEEEIVQTFDKAVANGDNELAVGMILHAAEVYHGNEMIQMHKALEDVYADDGKTIITKKGENFRQGNSGVRGFFKQYVMGKMGLSEQEALFIQSQFASSAKSVNHMNLSESVGVKNGLFYQRSDAEQQGRAHGESMKADAETLLRRYNRIGWGDEIQYKDDEGKTKRRFVPTDLTKKDFLKLAPTIDLEVNDRKRLNPNLSENIFVNYMLKETDAVKYPEKHLAEIMRELGTTYIAKGVDTPIAHEQLALETIAFGGDKYIGNLAMEKLDKIAAGATAADIKKIDDKINDAKKMIADIKDVKLKASGMYDRTAKKVIT